MVGKSLTKAMANVTIGKTTVGGVKNTTSFVKGDEPKKKKVTKATTDAIKAMPENEAKRNTAISTGTPLAKKGTEVRNLQDAEAKRKIDADMLANPSKYTHVKKNIYD